MKKRLYLPIIFILISVAFLLFNKIQNKPVLEKAHAQLQLHPFFPTSVPPTITPIPQPTSPPTPTTPPGHPTNTPIPGQPTSTPNPAQPTNTPIPGSNNIECLVNQVSEQKIKEYLENLVDNDEIPGKDEQQTRRTATNGNTTEANYIKKHFQDLGLESEFQPFTVSGQNTNNIIGRLNGENTNEYYLVVAHMDSTSEQAATLAPGADDNGTGTVLVMEAARVFKACNFQPKRSIEFIGFSAEEQGLLGSKYYVNNLPSGKTILGVINVDMIGTGRSSDCVDFGYKSYSGGNLISDMIVSMNTRYNIGLSTRSYTSSQTGSDHYNFWNANIPAVYGAECQFSSVYHRTTDTTQYINYSQLTKTTKAVVAALGEFTN